MPFEAGLDLTTTRSKIMACVRSKGNKSTELKFISILKSYSIFEWQFDETLLGKPDFVFPKKGLAVFIDGCFWHGCVKHCRLPATNVQYWVEKIKANARRDKHVTKELKKKGWIVIRFWEHELKGGVSLNRKMKRLKNILLSVTEKEQVTQSNYTK